MGAIALMEFMTHHAKGLWPELTGGFLAYWVHASHHRLYHFILRPTRRHAGAPADH